MFQMCSKLKLLKSKLKALNNREYDDLPARVKEAKRKLENIQRVILSGQGEPNLTHQEHAASTNYYMLAGLEENFYYQKSRIKWLKLGDRNTSYFFNSLKRNYHRNNISTLTLEDGIVTTDGSRIKEAVVTYFQKLFTARTEGDLNQEAIRAAITTRITDDQSNSLCRPVTATEIRNALFAMCRNKAPEPDGYTVEFFVECWQSVGELFTSAVLSFFQTSRLLKEVSNTLISLIPKVPNPCTLSD